MQNFSLAVFIRHALLPFNPQKGHKKDEYNPLLMVRLGIKFPFVLLTNGRRREVNLALCNYFWQARMKLKRSIHSQNSKRYN